MVVRIAEFFRSRTPPVDAQETLELYAFMEAAQAIGLIRTALAPAAITGATGNQEFFVHLRRMAASDR